MHTGTRPAANAAETHLLPEDCQDKVPPLVYGRTQRPVDLDENETGRPNEQVSTSPNSLSVSSDHAPQTGHAYKGPQGKLDFNGEARDGANKRYKGARHLPTNPQLELTMPANNNPTASTTWPQSLYVATPPGLPLLPLTSLPQAHHLLTNYVVRTRTYPRHRPAHRILPGSGASLIDSYRAYNQAMTGPAAHQLGDRVSIGSNNVHYFEDVHLEVGGETLDFHHYAMAFGTAANVPAGETHADIRHSRLFVVYELITPQPEHTVMPGLTTQHDPNASSTVRATDVPTTSPAPAPSPTIEGRTLARHAHSPNEDLEIRTRETLDVSPSRSESPIFVLKSDDQSVNQLLQSILRTVTPLPPPTTTISPMALSTIVHEEDCLMDEGPAEPKDRGTTPLLPALAYPSPVPSQSDACESETIASSSATSESWDSSEWRDDRSEDSTDLNDHSASDIDDHPGLKTRSQLGTASSAQVRREPNMEYILDRLTHTLDNANSPLDSYDVDAIRSESIRSFRAVRRRAERDGIQYAQDYLHVGPGSIHHAVRAQPSFDEYNHPFRGNPILYPFERVSLAELREYFRRHPTSDSQRQYENDTDAILLIIDTLLDYHPAASYNLALHSRRIRGLLGPVGGFPPTH